jgi:hypothetical protein
LQRLHELIGDPRLRLAQTCGAKWGGVVDVHDPKLQAASPNFAPPASTS